MANIEKILRQMTNETNAKTFAFNASEAQKARDFQKDMSDTSHQREVEDLKRAGINPVLSANGGASAYSASSASASADNSAVGALASIYMNKQSNVNSARIAAKQRANELKIAKLNAKVTSKSNANAKEIAKINAAASKYASDNASSASKYASELSYDASLYGSDTSAKSSYYSTDKKYSSTDYGVIDNISNPKVKKFVKAGYLGSKVLGNVFGSLGNIKNLFKSKKK